MSEIVRIINNNTGEKPKGQKTTIRVADIEKAEEKLDVLKNFMIVFLENQDLDINSEDWEEILPSKTVKFINQLDDEDFENDDILFPLKSLLYDLKIKKWEWYSSKLNSYGFEIITTDSFFPRYCWMVHAQNIPFSKIWIEDDRFGNYQIETLKDVTTYKDFDFDEE